MELKLKRLILILMLGMFSVNSYAERFKYPIGNSDVRLDIDHTKSVVTDFRVDGQRFSGRIIEPSIIEHVPTGARSLEKIPVKVTASVSRAGVLAGVGALVRQGAKLGTRAVPYVGTALLAYDIYKELNPELEKAGFRYSEDIGDYVKYYDNALCLTRFREEPGYYSCVGVDSSELLALQKGSKETEDLLVRRVRAEFEKLADKLGEDYGERGLFKYIHSCFYLGDVSVSCGFRQGGTLRLSFNLKQKIKTPEPDSKSFDDLISKKVDQNPDKFIKATGFPGYKEDIEVAPGTKLNIGPVTDKSGNPVQLLVSFGRDSQGKTTADVQVTPRPDLKPGSAEAPNVRPLPETSPSTNPSNNPNPNENPGTRPSPEPDPDTNPEPNLKPGTSPGSPVMPAPSNGKDGKDGKDGQDGGLLCRFFPNILACDQIPEPSADSDPQLPNETVNVEFEKSGIFQDSAQCPAPVTFTITVLDSSKQFAFSFENACTIAERLRYMLLALAWAVAAFFCIRTVSREV